MSVIIKGWRNINIEVCISTSDAGKEKVSSKPANFSLSEGEKNLKSLCEDAVLEGGAGNPTIFTLD